MLYAIAELGGQKWIDLANNTVEATLQGRSLTFKERLLADIQDIFESHDLEEITSIELAGKLNELEFRPYGEMNENNGITQNSIANILKGYEIRPKPLNDIYVEGKRVQKRGYKKEWFADAWERHLTSGNIIPFPAETSAQSVTTSQVNAGNGFKHSASVTSLICVTPENARKGNGGNVCDTVTPIATDWLDKEIGPILIRNNLIMSSEQAKSVLSEQHKAVSNYLFCDFLMLHAILVWRFLMRFCCPVPT